MKAAVIVFPGSNCDHDAVNALEVLGHAVSPIWHKANSLADADLVVLPGGFSYGDYLRTGAIARFSPIMRRVTEFAAAGGPVIGVCNGFQILLEAGLLPGGMRRNRDLRFICEHVYLRVEATDTPFTRLASEGQVLRIPIAHGEGNYYADDATLAELDAHRQVIFRYTAPDGTLDEQWNVNGSTGAIAGIANQARNVVGLMPHPERACEASVGSTDGCVFFESVAAELAQNGVVAAATAPAAG